MILQLYHLPPPHSPLISNSSCLFTPCQPLCVSCCTVPLYFSRYVSVPWTVTCQAPLSMGFSRQEYWSGLPFPSPGDLHHPGIKSTSLMPPLWQLVFFTTSTTWEAHFSRYCTVKLKTILLFVFVFVYYLCEKYYTPITLQYSTIWLVVFVGSLG